MKTHAFITADNDPMVRKYIRYILADAFPGSTILECHSIDGLVEILEKQTPSLVLLDQHMPGSTGLPTVEELTKRWPGVRIAIVSAFHIDLRSALRAGAKGVIPKGLDYAGTTKAIKAMLDGLDCGELYYEDPVYNEYKGAIIRNLGKRKTQIAALLLEGKQDKEIARLLGIAPQTVKDHLTDMREALKANNRTQLSISYLLFWFWCGAVFADDEDGVAGALRSKLTPPVFDAADVKPLTGSEIKAIRSQEKVSRAVLAKHLNISVQLLEEWESGLKEPCGPSLKLLSLVKAKGLGAIM